MDLKQSIRSEVSAIVPLDDVERRHQADVLAWIDSGAELCRLQKPATPPKHLVSYFLLSCESKVLLVDHINAKLWLPTGGHVEPGEHPKDTVRREIREELGIAADFLCETPLMVTVTETVGLTAGHTDVSLWYALRGDSNLPLLFDLNEFHGVRWFDIEALPLDRTDPHLARFVQKLESLS